MIVWLTIFNFAVKYDFSRKILEAYPGFCSGYLFSKSGPTREQAKQVNILFFLFI